MRMSGIFACAFFAEVAEPNLSNAMSTNNFHIRPIRHRHRRAFYTSFGSIDRVLASLTGIADDPSPEPIIAGSDIDRADASLV